MTTGRLPAERQQQILEIVRSEGIVRVNELSKLFGVSVLTIRRDLDQLDGKGFLERTHGGAVLRQSMSVEPPYSQKEQANIQEKISIAAKAAELIDEGDTVLVNSGSTTLAVIHALMHKRVTIMTNNIGAARFAEEASFDLLLLGGNYRHQSNSVIGDIGLRALEGVYANKAIIGVDGFSLTYGLTTPIMQEAEMTRRMIEKTVGTVIVVADSSKIGVVSNFKTADVHRISYLVTDRRGESILSDSELRESGVTLVLADG